MNTRIIPLQQVTIGVLLYESDSYMIEHYLASFFKSVYAQTYQHIEVAVLDNGSTSKGYLERLKLKFPQLKIFVSKWNKGFGGGHNQLIRESKGPYYMVLNPDMILEYDMVEKLIQCLKRNPDAGIVTGKIYRWDYLQFANSKGQEEGKTTTIDTMGLGVTREHRFFDRGQTEEDRGQYDTINPIFGASGVCMLIKRDALEHIRYKDEYFDETIFMYKEDIDLCYRMNWAGYRTYMCSEAIAYHDRTVAKDVVKNEQVRRWSYLNEKILLHKNMDIRFPCSIRFLTIFRQWRKKMYAHIKAPFLLEEEKNFIIVLPEVEKRKSAMLKKERPQYLTHFFTWN